MSYFKFLKSSRNALKFLIRHLKLSRINFLEQNIEPDKLNLVLNLAKKISDILRILNLPDLKKIITSLSLNNKLKFPEIP